MFNNERLIWNFEVRDEQLRQKQYLGCLLSAPKEHLTEEVPAQEQTDRSCGHKSDLPESFLESLVRLSLSWIW